MFEVCSLWFELKNPVSELSLWESCSSELILRKLSFVPCLWICRFWLVLFDSNRNPTLNLSLLFFMGFFRSSNRHQSPELSSFFFHHYLLPVHGSSSLYPSISSVAGFILRFLDFSSGVHIVTASLRVAMNLLQNCPQTEIPFLSSFLGILCRSSTVSNLAAQLRKSPLPPLPAFSMKRMKPVASFWSLLLRRLLCCNRLKFLPSIRLIFNDSTSCSLISSTVSWSSPPSAVSS